MPFITVQDYKTYYDVQGTSGKPLLFIHGAGGTSKCWADQVVFFSDDYHAIAIDLPGHGLSKGEGFQDLAAYREFLRAFLDALLIPEAVLCGHSMGGAIALDFAFHYPSRAEAIILAGSGANFDISPQYLSAIQDNHAQARMGARERLFAKKTPLAVIEKHEANVAQTPGTVFYSDLLACSKFDLSAGLGRLQLPVLIICGQEDAVVAGQTELLKAGVPHAKVKLITDAAHLPMLEQPRIFNAVVSSFLQDLLQSTFSRIS